MLFYPTEADVLYFLRQLVESLQPFAKAHSVALTFESDDETLTVSYHPETIAPDLIRLLCRMVTFTPQYHDVSLKATWVDAKEASYLRLRIENTGVNLSLIGEIVSAARHRVIVHGEKDNGTAYEIHWPLKKQADDLQATTAGHIHPPDNVRGFYAAVRERMRRYFQKEEQRMEALAVENPQAAIFLQKVNLVIEAHIGDESFDVEKLARFMAIGRMQLHRRLKPLVNTSPAHYIRDIRLEKARAMIQQEDISIGEICFRLGFQSQSHFTRVFIKKFGVRPMAYRRGK